MNSNKKLIGIASGSIISAVVLVLFLSMPSEMMLNEMEFTEQENGNNPVVAEINDQKIVLYLKN